MPGHADTPYCTLGNPKTVGSYVQADPTNVSAGNASTAFDDIVTYKERWQLQAGNDPVLEQMIFELVDAGLLEKA